MTFATLKRELPIDYVLDHYGFDPMVRESGALLYHVPWRNDDKPSLAVFPREGSSIFDGWADRAGPGGGDVGDLIARLKGYETPAQTLAAGTELLELLAFEGWEGPSVPERTSRSLDQMKDEVNRAYLEAEQGETINLDSWLSERGADYDAAFLRETFHVVPTADGITIPYLDQNRDLVGYRYRNATGPVLSPAGAKQDHGYGLHLHEPGRRLIICEGESDTWQLAWHMLDNVVGIPGAATRPDKIDIGLEPGVPVVLAFDGDRAGREANAMWAAHLEDHEVFIAPIPEGKDCGDLDEATLRQVFDNLRPVTPGFGGISAWRGKYMRLNADGTSGMTLSNFTADVIRSVITDAGTFYEVDVRGSTLIVTVDDSINPQNFTRWCRQHDLLWKGSAADLTNLLALWVDQALYRPVVLGTGVAGHHESAFVWPGGKVGKGDMEFVNTDVLGVSESDFRMSPSPTPEAAAEAVLGFLEVYPHHVTTPLLAWLAAAPLRDTVEGFPYLFVHGKAGTGKSTLMERCIPIITGMRRVIGLGTNPTPYAMATVTSSSNAFPVTFDEYRVSGSRKNQETIWEMNNIIRAAWNQQARETGGGGNPRDIIRKPVLAPLIVTGEIDLEEDSTRHRAVPVFLLKEERGDLSRLLAADDGTSHFAPLYLDYLLSGGVDGEGVRLEETLEDRTVASEHYMMQGWQILQDFMSHIGRPIDHIDLDLSAVNEAHEETMGGDPLLDALSAVMGSTRAGQPAVWEHDGEVFVSVEQFAKEARDLGLPVGNPVSIGRDLAKSHGAVDRRIMRGDSESRVRVRVIDASLLD